MRITDIVVLILGLYYLWRGWRKGLFRTILGPFSLLLCVVAAYIYYQQTGNLLTSIAIGMAGPIVVTLIFSILLYLWGKVQGKEAKLSLVSRMVGAGLSFSWAAAMIVLSFVIFSFIPAQYFPATSFRDDINGSMTFAYLSEVMEDRIPSMKQVRLDQPIIQTEASQEMLRSTDEYQFLIEDERIKDLLSDERIVTNIEEKNYMQLLTDPKMQQVYADKELVESFIKLSNRLVEINNQQASQIVEIEK
ncbi:MAG: CvpA family protein [Candidatus Omnitrophica bacterium]|nr:CvpA family protein [Candidatus Omnitrophota bacterium]